MTDHLFLALLCAFVPTMVCGGLALWAVYSERFKQYRVRTPVLVVHAFVNIVVHTGLVLPHPVFRLTNYWVIRHDRHTYKHVNTNIAQVFSFWDMMFGTHK